MEIVTDKSFKYNLKRLDLKTEEFKFVKKFFDLTIDPVHGFKNVFQVNDFRIYTKSLKTVQERRKTRKVTILCCFTAP